MEQKRQKAKVVKIIAPEERGSKQWVKYLPLALVFIVILIVFSMRGKGEKPDEKKIPSVQEKNVIAPDEKKVPQHREKLMIKLIPDIPTARQDLEMLVADGGNVSFRWEKNGVIIAGENSQRLSKDKFKKGDAISAAVTADGETTTVSVVIRNSPPEVVSVPFSPQKAHRGVDMAVVPKGFDADGDEVEFRYQWIINGEEIAGEDTSVLRGDRFKKGDEVSVRVIPYDKEDEGAVYNTKPLIIPNGPPMFTSSPPLEFKGYTYTYNAAAQDPDGDAVVYSLASAPKGMMIDDLTGRIVWQFTKNDEGSHAIEVVAQDTEGLKGFQKYTLAITIPKEEKQ